MVSVTLDTNTVDDGRVVEAARLAGFELARTTVTDRELESSEVQTAFENNRAVIEPFVMGESAMGIAALGSRPVADAFERLLQVISNGSFPARGRRLKLSAGERRQLRDAMILSAHIRDGRDIFVTNDRKGFIQGGLRERLETEFALWVGAWWRACLTSACSRRRSAPRLHAGR
jgi:hypothetical protein